MPGQVFGGQLTGEANREVIGWSLTLRMTVDITIDALVMACFRRKPAPGLIHHSERESPYVGRATEGMRHDLLDEPEGEALGKQAKCRFASRQARGRSPAQRTDRALLQQLRERAGTWHTPRNESRSGCRRIRLHRAVLQPQVQAFDAGLSLTTGFPGEPDQESA
ncbi:MAG: hypothetical protein JNK99_12125 [Candidatus Accumulibacter sp.]|nr:hypothetical protein [Accumulibacter sp.]